MTCIFVAKLPPFSKNRMLSRGQVQFKGNLSGDANLRFGGLMEAFLALWSSSWVRSGCMQMSRFDSFDDGGVKSAPRLQR